MARETVRIEGLAGVLDVLKQLPSEIVSKAGGPVKLGLKKAAEGLRDRAQMNVQRIVDKENKDGEPSKSLGILKRAVIAKRGGRMRVKGESYIIAIKRGQKYPASRGKNLTAAQIGRQLEYGTEHRDADPWMRPAYDEGKREAVETFTKEVTTRTEAIVKRLERKARRK